MKEGDLVEENWYMNYFHEACEKEDLYGKNFPSSQDDFWKTMHEILHENFKVSKDAFSSIPHSLRLGGESEDYILKIVAPWSNG